MRSRAVICTMAIAASLASPLSFAQPRPDRHEPHGQRQDAHGPRGDHRDMRDEHRDMRDERRGPREERGHRGAREDRHEEHAYYNARGPEFRRGARLPPELRARPYVVRDWRAYRLAPPPRGYEWIQVGPDFVLAAIATGVIVTIVLAP